MPPLPRKKIGGYDVLGVLDEGGMGVVYLALQAELDRKVVIKALRKDQMQSRQLDERFRREAETASRIQHQNVVAVHDCFVWRGQRYIVQEYVDGADLHEVIGKVGRLEARPVARIALELVRGLEEIHLGGVVHRDLKPSNVLLSKDGEVKVADFGIAFEASGERLTRTGYAVGTPPYMSPEQLLGERVDARSDLFAFGVLLYEMLTGAPPFELGGGDDEPGDALIHRIQSGRYTHPRRLAPATPRWLSALVMACLRGKPAKRPPSSAAVRALIERRLQRAGSSEVRQELAEWMSQRGVFPEPSDGTRLVTLPVRRSRSRLLLATAAVLCAAFLAAGLGTGFIGFEKLRSLPDRWPGLGAVSVAVPALGGAIGEPDREDVEQEAGDEDGPVAEARGEEPDQTGQ